MSSGDFKLQEAQVTKLSGVLMGASGSLRQLFEFLKAVQEIARMPEFAVIVNPVDINDPRQVQGYLVACLKVSRVVVRWTPNKIDDAVWEAAIAAVQSEAFPVIYKLVRGLLDGSDQQPNYNVMMDVVGTPDIVLLIQLALLVVNLLKDLKKVVKDEFEAVEVKK